ncbi:hypothetical protein QJQ45_028346 [Haematococcus lacustris]|nr:hypothetical protein QJQ45_028346 [Haematococcus lacustris]
MASPREQANAYIETHNVRSILGTILLQCQTLTAQLLFHKPDNPRSFLIKYLEKVKVEGAQPLIDENDLRTTFAMLDVLKRGSVTEDQALSTLRSMLGAGASLSDHPGAVPHGKFLKELATAELWDAALTSSDVVSSYPHQDEFVAVLMSALKAAHR